jgi:hypothetical protein
MNARSRLPGIVAVVTIAACGTKEAAAPLTSDPAGRIRFVNLISDNTRYPVNVYMEGLPLGVNVTSGAAAPATLPAPATAFYAAVLAGDRSLLLKLTSDTSTTIGVFNITITAGQDRTVYALGAGAISASTVDTNPLAAATETRFRIVNMSTNLGAADVFVTAAGADLTGATPSAANLGVQAASAYFSLPPAAYQVRFVAAGTPPASRNASVLLTLATTTYVGGTGRTILAADGVPPTLRRAILLGDR